jgi:hypothetical protein
MYVPVAAEATFFGCFSDMYDRWVAIVGLFDVAVQSRQLRKDGNDTRRFILYLFLFDEATITTDSVDKGYLGAGIELIMQPLGHMVLPCVGPEFGSLETRQLLEHVLGRIFVHQGEHSCLVAWLTSLTLRMD